MRPPSLKMCTPNSIKLLASELLLALSGELQRLGQCPDLYPKALAMALAALRLIGAAVWLTSNILKPNLNNHQIPMTNATASAHHQYKG